MIATSKPRILLSLLVGAILSAPFLLTAAQSLGIHGGSDQASVLHGPMAGQQLVAMDGQRDVTREATFSSEPAEIVAIDETGYVTPVADGKTTVTATLGENQTVSLSMEVRQSAVRQRISFPNDVVPILTRSECNAGACHAKVTGQNGFQLSLLGYDPGLDFEQLTQKSRGRRVFPAAPEYSLVLMKTSGDLPHEGGVRLEKESPAYQTIHQWIEDGMPYDPDQETKVERIEVYPERVVMQPGTEQQLSVTAFFDDGSSRDVTRLVQYESNQPEMAEADEHGLVQLSQKTGTASVMIRFQEHMDVFMATIPLGLAMPEMPKPENFIDEHIFRQLELLGLPPSDLSEDGTFLRRATLNIAGRLPTVEETEAFLADQSPNKRAATIDRLLETTDYADFFAGKWAGILRNKVNRGSEWVTRDSYAFHAWIRSSFLENKPFDQFAGELIEASGKAIENPAVSWYRVIQDQKEQMQDVAQVFLGVRMQCAQCHHHPYERWSQDDYYSFAAFFSTVERKNTRKLPEEDVVFHNMKPAAMKHPGTGEMLKPRLLGDSEALELPLEVDPRTELSNWIQSPENDFFARTLVNRYWKHFFGRGLVEPEDDIRPTNPATHPELLDELAVSFTESGYDLKELIRTICNSHAWQLSSTIQAGNGEDEQNYARFYPRRLQAEVLLDSINDITDSENSFSELPRGLRAIALPNEEANKQSEFLTMFGRPAMDTACECERTGAANLGQSLHLINSDTIQTKLSSSAGRAFSLARDKERTDLEKLRALYLEAFSREPFEDELAIALAHLEKKRDESAADPEALKPSLAEQQAFEDIIWVMLNTKEFMFTH